MQTKAILRENKAINDIKEAQGTGKLSGSSFRAIDKMVTTTENMELIRTVLQYHPTTWLSLRRNDIPITIIMEAFHEANEKARGAMLRSEYGANIHTRSKQLTAFEYSQLLQGNESKELHDYLKSRQWETMKPVFTFSMFTQSNELIEIANTVKQMDASDVVNMVGIRVGELYRQILNHRHTDTNTVLELFDLKAYDLDREIMQHHKTSQELKDKITNIMNEYRGAGK